MRQNFLLIFNIFAILSLKNLVKSDVVNNNTIIKINNNNKTLNAFANTTNIAITNFQTKLTNGADLSKVQLQEVKPAAAEKLIIGQTPNNNTEKTLRRKITSTSNVNPTATTSTTTTTSTAQRKNVTINNEKANTSSSKLPQINGKILENSTNANNKTTKDQQQAFFYIENGPISIPQTTATITNDIVNKTKLTINDKSKSNNTNNNAQLTISTQSINATNSNLNKTTTITATATTTTKNSTSTTPLTKSTNTKINTDIIANKTTKIIATITTEKPKPKKPVITYGVEDFPELDRNVTNNIKNIKDTANKIQLEEPQTEAVREPPIVEPSQEYNGHDYIVPIATIILIIPLAIGTFIVAYRRLRDLWATRHYRRMDFLVDGMYND